MTENMTENMNEMDIYYYKKYLKYKTKYFKLVEQYGSGSKCPNINCKSLVHYFMTQFAASIGYKKTGNDSCKIDICATGYTPFFGTTKFNERKDKIKVLANEILTQLNMKPPLINGFDNLLYMLIASIYEGTRVMRYPITREFVMYKLVHENTLEAKNINNNGAKDFLLKFNDMKKERHLALLKKANFNLDEYFEKINREPTYINNAEAIKAAQQAAVTAAPQIASQIKVREQLPTGARPREPLPTGARPRELTPPEKKAAAEAALSRQLQTNQLTSYGIP